jgi:phage tail-like protein
MNLHPTGKRVDPVLGYNFLISLIDSTSSLATVALSAGIQQPPIAGFSECSGMEMTLQLEEYEEGGNNGTVRKFPKRINWTNIRFRRGVAGSTDLWDWHYAFVIGNGKRRDGTITLQNELRQPIRTWTFRRALPVKWTGPSMNALQSQVAIEELEIAHEGVEVVSTGGQGVLGEAVSAVRGALEAIF